LGLLHALQRRFRWGVENLMLYITGTMLAVFLADRIVGIPMIRWIVFSRAAILRGEVWRLASFIFIPPSSSLIWIVIALYFYYFIGQSMEREWGADKFTFYYLIGIIANIIAGLITGGATNHYLNLSLFFAFAQLNPEMQIRLFMVIPVKVKWVAWVNWAFFGFSLFTALLARDLISAAAIVVSILNFLLFFGPDMLDGIRARKRRDKYRSNFDDFWR